LIGFMTGEKYCWYILTLNRRLLVAERLTLKTPTANINPPYLLALKIRLEGSGSNTLDSEVKIICLSMVLIPMLANKMIKMMIIAMEMSPPVAVVYSGSPL
jgi:hypothetical protein